MLPLLTNPRGLIFITEPEPLAAAAAAEYPEATGAGPVVRSVSNSDMCEAETGTEELPFVVAGIEKPTTDEVGSALRDGPGNSSEDWRSKDAHDFLGIATGGAEVSTACGGCGGCGGTATSDDEGGISGVEFKTVDSAAIGVAAVSLVVEVEIDPMAVDVETVEMSVTAASERPIGTSGASFAGVPVTEIDV